jgi:hypothetical protein
MIKSLETKMLEIRSILKDFPADASTHVLLSTLREILAPVHAQIMNVGDNKQSELVAKQIKLITDISSAIIEMLDVKEVEIKN